LVLFANQQPTASDPQALLRTPAAARHRSANASSPCPRSPE